MKVRCSDRFQQHGPIHRQFELPGKSICCQPPGLLLDIFPRPRNCCLSRRKASEATIRQCKTGEVGPSTERRAGCGCRLPWRPAFPIPQSGNEVLWNHNCVTRSASGYSTTASSNSWIVDSNGSVTKGPAEQQRPLKDAYYQVDQDRR